MKLCRRFWLDELVAVNDPDLMAVAAVVPGSWFHYRAIPFVFERIDFEYVGTLGAVHASTCNPERIRVVS